MMKLSKDNLGYWRAFGIGFLVIHSFFIIFVISMNFWPVYLVYAFFALMHFAVGKVWRYLFIADVFINTEQKTVVFKGNDKVTEVSIAEVINYRTYFGITDVLVSLNGSDSKFYFMPNSKENLKYLNK
ncbi:hypothetical protein IDJ77_21250 [Mucilaginibacter sp. ZT4R22]|uniref:PH (Pleckstrin Homology) domain-containing protein n=1 Tax=Mucilaginibacter pankratovii TaxID=2772110 RepID=A0ABR7WVN1_9SPHI|nr:hypothetical protein [Mucilaginibacter pankratovii]MBD1366354.1 hypothetical protein [Mucilaginibacter pankratovii]